MYPTNYNYYPQQQTAVNQQPPGYQNPYLRQAPSQISLKGRLVSSLEEARATSIDFDGSVFYFPDLANKRIYTKQIAMDGTAVLNVYELREIPIEKEGTVTLSADKFVTKEEFQQVLAQLRQTLIPQEPEAAAPQPKKTEVLPF